MSSGGMSEDEIAAWVDSVLPKAFAFARNLVTDVGLRRIWFTTAFFDFGNGERSTI